MDEDDGMLSAGFAIDTQGAFSELQRFYQFFDSGTIKVLDEMRKVEVATGGMMKLGGATREVAAFSAAAKGELTSVRQTAETIVSSVGGLSAAISVTGAAASREARALAREKTLTATAGEALIRTLEREAMALGKTKEEMRAAKIEAIALSANQQGNTDLADRLLAAARQRKFAADSVAEAEEEAGRKVAASAAQQEQALRSAAFAHDQFEAAARRGVSAMREQDAAAERDAASLAQLRAMVDPAATAQERLNREIAEARRVMTAAGASAAELGLAEKMLGDRAESAAQRHDMMAGSARKSGFALQTVALQLPDITQGLLTGQKPMTVFIQQGFQIVQVGMMAEGGLRGFGKELGALALRFSLLLIGLAAAGAGFALFNRWINEGVKNEQLTSGLGKITGGADATKQELFKLKDATITWADTSSALFTVVGKDVAAVFVGDMKTMGKDVKSVLDDLTSYGRQALAGLYAGVAGMKAYLGEVEKGGVLGIGKMLIGQGDPKLIEKTFGAQYDIADKYLTKLGGRVRTEAIKNARERNAKTIGFNNEPKPKTDQHAASLARDAEATEAQIRNLYKLAEAYGVSGAAALIAEARVKAESAAIRKRADIEASVDRQVRLSIAQRVSDSEKGSATMRDQARIQTMVNGEVAAGNVSASHANELMQQRLAELPLLFALEAAQQRGLKTEVEKATKALDDQRSAQADLDASAMGARFVAADSAANDRLADLREELSLIGATDAARTAALATTRATREAEVMFPGALANQRDYIAKQVEISGLELQSKLRADALNDSLSYQGDLLDQIATNVSNAAQGMADAFGEVGRAIGDTVSIYASFAAQQERVGAAHKQQLIILNQNTNAEQRDASIKRENGLFATKNATAQVGLYGDMTHAAKGFFKEGSDGYKAMATAEKVFRAVEFAMSIRSIAQDAIETITSITNSGARAAAAGAEGVANQSKLPFPANLAAMAATAAALVGAGIAVAGGFGGGKNTLPKANDGTGTVLGDTEAKSESIKRAIDDLKNVDTLMLTSSREMAGLLRSIDSQIGGVASLIVRAGDVNASGGVSEGFKTNAVGSVLKAIVPVFGGALASLFGTKTKVVGSGLSGGPQSLDSILNGGFDASYYSDVQKKKKLFGITTSTKYATQYTGADAGLENQFTLILKNFNGAIAAAAGPLGESTAEIQRRLSGFIVDIGKIDLQGLTGDEIQEKLSAVFGAAADKMALAAFPGFERFQKVGEGAFETLVRVASTVEAVSASLDLLGGSARGLGIDAKLGLADQFDSVSDFNSAADAYFQTFYSKEEQAAAKTAQFAKVFDSLGMAIPETLAGFRQLVDAQNLTTSAGQSTYATLLQLAPAFADLKSAMDGAKSAADILAERQDLERKMLELNGDTAAIRALDLAKVDVSNRMLQQQVWAIQDAQAAASAAKQLSYAWSSVGDSIDAEIKRIRGLSDGAGGTTFATAMGEFNAATNAARGGDQDAAKLLPGLSQALLKLAGDNATSRQELDRVQSQTAASLEQTSAVIAAIAKGNLLTSAGTVAAAAVAASAVAPAPTVANDARDPIAQLRDEIAQMRADNNAGHSATAGNTARMAKKLDDVTSQSGGDAIAIVAAA
ncbi:hypothetical protein ASE69_03550 [Sphingomonas sp. Leaf208]|uniref:phage tail length tape measure family protein n=1 Tax=Sphingomonas sp. Leaf208 TaxID=1735679 RepID=UPI0006F6CF46|nr:phage tail length tape measure family protein [Sphingomonas sp. Leaf208]KQM56701.1 hypothetical protein ASE69_03550 [Sphingomonas sp. Leaf208]